MLALRTGKTDYSQNLRIINLILILCLPLLFFGKYGQPLLVYFGVAVDERLPFLLQSIFPFYGVNLLAHILYNRLYFRRVTR